MPLVNEAVQLPAYQSFVDTIAVLDLPVSGSELHGVICGFLCAGAVSEGETWLRGFVVNSKEDSIRAAVVAMFGIFAISQQQIDNLDFAFELLLPGDHESLANRARAFSEWCGGFVQGMTMSGVEPDSFEEEEAQDALQNLQEFAELDYHSLEIDEDDEKALMEVSEYTRMAVLRMHSELKPGGPDNEKREAH